MSKMVVLFLALVLTTSQAQATDCPSAVSIISQCKNFLGSPNPMAPGTQCCDAVSKLIGSVDSLCKCLSQHPLASSFHPSKVQQLPDLCHLNSFPGALVKCLVPSGSLLQPLGGSGSFLPPLFPFPPLGGVGGSGSFLPPLFPFPPLDGSGPFLPPLDGSGSFLPPLIPLPPLVPLPPLAPLPPLIPLPPVIPVPPVAN